MNKENWELVASNGYTFEFEHKEQHSTTLTIIATSEDHAWNKLKHLN